MLGKVNVKGMYLECNKRWMSAGMKFADVTRQLTARVRNTQGQGTVEYAILVGVLVVIAIIAVVAFKGKLQELWSNITEGINRL